MKLNIDGLYLEKKVSFTKIRHCFSRYFDVCVTQIVTLGDFYGSYEPNSPIDPIDPIDPDDMFILDYTENEESKSFKVRVDF